MNEVQEHQQAAESALECERERDRQRVSDAVFARISAQLSELPVRSVATGTESYRFGDRSVHSTS
jgi:hypothetical protein